LNEATNSILNLCLRIVAEQPAGLGNVSVGLGHITRLWGLAINNRMRIEFLFQKRNQFA